VSFELERAFKAEGIEVVTGVKVLDVRASGKAKKIRYLCGDKKKELEVDEILYALGRVPAVEGLKLENAGVTVEGGRMKLDSSMATTSPHIFAAGDVAGTHDVVHIGIHQGECAARNAVRHLRGGGDAAERMDYRLKAVVTFTDPEVASVGLNEGEAKAAGIDFISASYPFNDHGKAMIGGYEYGFVKIVARKATGEIIGAEIIGPDASDLIHELIAVMYFRGTVQDVARMPHYHPTLAEIITHPAEELAEKMARAPVPMPDKGMLRPGSLQKIA
jgi:pyruvate/2-oxoglutarate dehydrogenase complex dihydrolipoamide dehydrogenase (E3) component